MKFKVKPVVAAVALALGASPAFAAKQFFGDRVIFNGFGSVGAAQTNTDDGEFRRDDQADGADRDPDINVDTNLGLQLTGKATDWLSATVQSLTRQRDDGKFSTEIEWAYVKLKPTRSVSLLAGRMTMPVFLVSDSRNVGYANTWLRPPNEVYGLAMLQRLEGANASYSLPVKSTTLTATAVAGKSQVHAVGTEIDIHQIRGGNLLWETDWLTLRAGFVRGHVTAFNDIYKFTGVGGTYDRDNVVVQTELVRRRSSGFGAVVDASGWYTLAGYRINKFLPYASYASTEPRSGGKIGHLVETQSTIAAGVRWDAFSSSAIKLQVERIDTHDTSGISFSTPVVAMVNTLPIFAPITKPVTAVSLAMDVVF